MKYIQCCAACCNCVRDNVTVQGKINCKENGYYTLSLVGVSCSEYEYIHKCMDSEI